MASPTVSLLYPSSSSFCRCRPSSFSQPTLSTLTIFPLISTRSVDSTYFSQACDLSSVAPLSSHSAINRSSSSSSDPFTLDTLHSKGTHFSTHGQSPAFPELSFPANLR